MAPLLQESLLNTLMWQTKSSQMMAQAHPHSYPVIGGAWVQQWFVLLMAGLLGLVVGSFLNVVALRRLKGESCVWPGSHCPSCGTPLQWFENIPVLSWLGLAGKCRTCKTPISVQYPLVELLTACLFMATMAIFHPTLTGLCVLWLVSLMMVTVITDFKEHAVFIDYMWWVMPTGLLAVWLSHSGLEGAITLPLATPIYDLFGYQVPPLLSALLGGLMGFGLFTGLNLCFKKMLQQDAFGEGDAWILAALGCYLGWERVVITFFMSMVIQSVATIPFMFASWIKQKQWSIAGWLALALASIALTFAPLGLSKAMMQLWTMGLTVVCMVSVVMFYKAFRDAERYAMTIMPLGPAIILAGFVMLFTSPLWYEWLP
jgi:leader peptidase (prepilin peptidase)/N-methyltransferase